MNSSEKELLNRLAESDPAAFEAVFHIYWDRIFSAALLLSRTPSWAEDTAQEIFLWIWKERLQMKNVENLEAYLSRAARNLMLRKLRHLKVEDKYKLTLLARAGDAEAEDPASSASHRELLHLLESGMDKLPPQQQRAFRLSREQGLSHRQIGKVMNLSTHTVKDYIVKSLAFLRKYLAQHGSLLILFVSHTSFLPGKVP